MHALTWWTPVHPGTRLFWLHHAMASALTGTQHHCRSTAHWQETPYSCDTEDSYGQDQQPLNMQQWVTVAGMSKKHTGKLPGQLELAVGMKAMVTMNITTERGVTRLWYLPAMILFKPYHYTFRRLEDLPDGVIPIFPSEIKFNIPHQGQTIRITRHLTAIMAGYAFTDYKSQGQTIEPWQHSTPM